MTERAVVLARGLGTRMRQEAPGAHLDAAQAAVADAGLKAFIPIGRPFLDYILSALADAGLTRLCVVIGPEHDVVRRYYTTEVTLRRISVDFAVQAEPRGTADAVLAAEAWTAGEPFLVVNGDNYYPVDVLSSLAALSMPGLVAFSREGLLADGQIAPERLQRFALLDLDGNRLRRIVEKPDQVDRSRFNRGDYVSMNCWRFDARIFDACRAGAAVAARRARTAAGGPAGDRRRAISGGGRALGGGVLDLSGRADIAAVAERLARVDVQL